MLDKLLCLCKMRELHAVRVESDVFAVTGEHVVQREARRENQIGPLDERAFAHPQIQRHVCERHQIAHAVVDERRRRKSLV